MNDHLLASGVVPMRRPTEDAATEACQDAINALCDVCHLLHQLPLCAQERRALESLCGGVADLLGVTLARIQTRTTLNQTREYE